MPSKAQHRCLYGRAIALSFVEGKMHNDLCSQNVREIGRCAAGLASAHHAATRARKHKGYPLPDTFCAAPYVPISLKSLSATFPQRIPNAIPSAERFDAITLAWHENGYAIALI